LGKKTIYGWKPAYLKSLSSFNIRSFIMFGLGASELLVIALIILVIIVFGRKKLPEIGKGLGSAVKGFKDIENDLTGTGSKIENSKKQSTETDESKSPIEAVFTRKLLGQLPGVKKVMSFKDKVDKVKDIIK
jgi:sec-independent protein translocase protein TatA